MIWLVWHLPPWKNTPHSEIALPLFAGHCAAYAVIIGAAHTLYGGSILPAILLHLAFNLASNMALFAGIRDPNAWFSVSLWPYLAPALASALLVNVRTGPTGIRWFVPQPCPLAARRAASRMA